MSILIECAPLNTTTLIELCIIGFFVTFAVVGCGIGYLISKFEL